MLAGKHGIKRATLTFVISWNLMGRTLPDPAMVAAAPSASYTTIRYSWNGRKGVRGTKASAQVLRVVREKGGR